MKVKVARIGKPHGIRGEVTVQLFTDEPELRFAPGTELLVEAASEAGAAAAPNGVLTVRSARWNKKILVVAFDQVGDRNAAEALRESQVFVDSDDADDAEDDGEAWYEHELLEMEVVVEETGRRIGVVTGLRTMPHQDLLEITLDADGRTVDIPFVEEIVAEVDEEAHRVLLTPPPGLLELGLDESQPGPDH